MTGVVNKRPRDEAGSPRRLLLTLLATSGLLHLFSYLLVWHNQAEHPESPIYGYFIEGAVNGPVLLALAWLLVARIPRHPVTWTFVATVVSGAVQQAAGGYAHEALLASAGGLPGGVPALFLSSAAQFTFVFLWLILVILFPSGDTVSPRWRVVLGAALLVPSVGVLVHLATPRPYADDHPLFAGIEGPLSQVLSGGATALLNQVMLVVAVVAVGGALLQLVVRFVRGAPEVRRQLSWFFYAVVAALLVLFIPWPGVNLLPGWFLWSLAPLGVWAAVAMAILRYRLYDIDLIINRTLVYAALTAVLVAAYAGGVLLFRTILDPVTGDNDVAIAASTLAVAALFGPARRKIQRFIDHRFYRSRYDAQQTLETFAARLRDEVDLESLTSDLAAVVHRTVQPRHVSVWLPAQGTRQ